MTTMQIDRAVVEEALDFIVATNKSFQFWLVPESNLNKKTVTALRAALAQQDELQPMPPEQRQRWEELAAMPQQAEPAQDIHGACPTHCCPVHGCKYMHDDCPVVSGAVQPVYPRNNGCESCADEAEPLNLSDRAVQRRLAAQWGYVPAAQAEPVEPVAWQWLDTAHYRKKIPADATPSHWRPLYTAPPQRKPLTEEVAALTAQRDALLEMLKLARSIIGHPDDAHSQMIDAAIKAVEEGK